MIPGRLDYNRRTGEFYVPGPGIVYLYDRPDESQQQGGAADAPEGRGRCPAAGRRPDRSAVVPTTGWSRRPRQRPTGETSPARRPRRVGRATCRGRGAARPAAAPPTGHARGHAEGSRRWS